MASLSSPSADAAYPSVAKCAVNQAIMLAPVKLSCCNNQVDYTALMQQKELSGTAEKYFTCPLCPAALGADDCEVDKEAKAEAMLGLYLNPQEFSSLNSKEQWMVKMWWAWHREEIEAVNRVYHQTFSAYPEQKAIIPKFPVPQNLGQPGGAFPSVVIDRVASKLTRQSLKTDQ